jgi:hypothetical protein
MENAETIHNAEIAEIVERLLQPDTVSVKALSTKKKPPPRSLR